MEPSDPGAESSSGYFTPGFPQGNKRPNAMDLTEPSIDRLRLKLRYKVLYHVGHNCADVDDLVQETLVRFFRAEQRKIIRNTDELGAFLNGVCRNVILEYRRRI